MGQPVALVLVLAVLVGLAAAYCLGRCVVPRWHAEHGVAVDAWHVAMGVAMVAMLLAPVGGWSAAGQAALFGIGALWCCCVLLARAGTGAHLRLGAACAVMAAMLMPAVVAPATAAPAAPPGHHHVPGMDMSQMSGSAAHADHAMAMPPWWLAVAMLVACAAIAAAALHSAWGSARRGDDRHTASRLGLACEVVMAGAMGYMAAIALG